MAEISQPKTVGALQELQQLSQEHENKLVIELGTDRIVKWLGVYFIFILAALLKVEEILGSSQKLTCFPENYLEPVSKSFIEFATHSCWESSEIGSSAEHCASANATNLAKSNNASAKIIIKILPLVWFALAFLNYLPTVWWHLSYGSRLLGHLKLIKYVLESTCQAINELKEVEYNGSPYDSDSVHLTGKKPFYDPVIAIALEQILNESRWLKDTILKTDKIKNDIKNSYQKLIDDHMNDCSNFPAERNEIQEKLIGMVKSNIDFIDKINLRPNAVLADGNSPSILLKSLKEIVETCQTCLKANKAGKRLSNEETSNLASKSTNFTNVTNIDCDEINEKHEECYRLISQDLFSTLTDEGSTQTSLELQSKRLKQELNIVKKNIDKLNQIKQSNKEIITCVKTIKNKLDWNRQKGNKATSCEIQDRHFLSLLCYENFASLYYIPYIYQVFRVYGIRAFHTSIERLHALEQQYTHESIPTERGTVTKPTSEVVLRSWCHPKNLTSKKLVCSYRKKQIGTVGIVLLGFSSHLYFFMQLIENVSSQSYFCALPHICLICSSNRLIQLTVLIGIVLATCLAIIFVLCYQLFDFYKCKNQSSDCCFFELFQDLSMDALYGIKAENAGNSSFFVNQSNSNMSNKIYSTDQRTTDYVLHIHGDCKVTFVNEQAQKNAGYSNLNHRGQVIKHKQIHSDQSVTNSLINVGRNAHISYENQTPEALRKQPSSKEAGKRSSSFEANILKNKNIRTDQSSSRNEINIGRDGHFGSFYEAQKTQSEQPRKPSQQPQTSTAGSSQKYRGRSKAQNLFNGFFSSNERSAPSHVSATQDQGSTSCPLESKILVTSESAPSLTMKEIVIPPQNVRDSSDFQLSDAYSLNESAKFNQTSDMEMMDFTNSPEEEQDYDEESPMM